MRMLGKAAHYGWKWTSDLTGKLYPEMRNILRRKMKREEKQAWKRAQRGETTT